MLLFIFILYQPTPGPGIIQRLGWQSWDLVGTPQQGLSVPNTTGDVAAGSPPAEQIPSDVDWWNVTTEEVVDQASLPLDVWAPLMPHDTGRASTTKHMYRSDIYIHHSFGDCDHTLFRQPASWNRDLRP
jgi:hypothetical protein